MRRAYLIRRVIFYFLALWAAITLNFLLPRLMPGNPALLMIARYKGKLTPAALHAFEAAFGFATRGSLVSQYGQYLGQLVHGNLGLSIAYFPEPVSQVIGTALPWTLFLVGLATVISFVVGTLLGIWSAWNRGRAVDTWLPTISTFTSAFPYFWFALLCAYVFGFVLNWFPTSHAFSGGHSAFSLANLPDIAYHAVLPAFTIVVSSIGGWLLGMRNNMVATLAEDHIVLAQAKGLPRRRVMYTYAARNAILPNLTGFAMSIGFVVGGALLTEIVFSYPGLGYTLLVAVQSEDYPLLQGALLVIAVAVLLANFVAELAYGWLDPRVDQEQEVA
jgi:peptide/nickel transport system permease protein